MRILTICLFYESSHGGGIVVARTLRQLMEERGHRVDILCLEGGDDPQPGTVLRLKSLPGVHRDLARQLLLFLNNGLFDRWFVRQLDAFGIKPGSYDVVHCQDFLGVGVGAAVAKKTGAQWGVTLHEFLPRRMALTTRSRWLGGLLEQTCRWRDRSLLEAYRSTTWVAGVSKAVSKAAEAFVSTWQCKVETVYNAYTPGFTASSRPVPRDGGPVRYLFVGRLSPEKGIDLLLEAFEAVKHPATLSVVGLDGALGDLVKTAAQRDPRIQLMPPQRYEAMAAIYQEHDVVCCPARWDEPFGLTTLEGRACGRVVVATRRGGMPEILDGYPRGILVNADPLKRRDAVRELATALIEAPKRLEIAIDPAVEAASLARFTTENFVRGYERLYDLVRY